MRIGRQRTRDRRSGRGGWCDPSGGRQCASAHEVRRVHLIVFVIGTKDVHRDVHRKANRVFSLQVAPGHDRSLPNAGGTARQRSAEIVLAEENLRLSAAHDCIERRRAFDAPYRAPHEVEALERPRAPASMRDRRCVREEPGKSSRRARSGRTRRDFRRAPRAPASSTRSIPEQKKRGGRRSLRPSSGPSSMSPLQ